MNIDTLVGAKPRSDMPKLKPGDTVAVRVKVVEGEKERIQVFQGVVICVEGGGMNASFTVRRVTYGVGVERKFFFDSPRVEKVEVIKHSKVRRARLYYLRQLSGKAGRLKEMRQLKELGLKVEEAKEEEGLVMAEGAVSQAESAVAPAASAPAVAPAEAAAAPALVPPAPAAAHQPKEQ